MTQEFSISMTSWPDLWQSTTPILTRPSCQSQKSQHYHHNTYEQTYYNAPLTPTHLHQTVLEVTTQLVLQKHHDTAEQTCDSPPPLPISNCPESHSTAVQHRCSYDTEDLTYDSHSTTVSANLICGSSSNPPTPPPYPQTSMPMLQTKCLDMHNFRVQHKYQTANLICDNSPFHPKCTCSYPHNLARPS